MIGLGDMINLHEYMWMNEIRKSKVNFSSAYCIVPSDEFYNVQAMYKNYYSQTDFITDISISRSGKPVIDFYIYRLSGWKGKLPVIQ